MDSQNASTETLSVHVRVLRIGREQVTRSLYQQIPRGFIIDPEQGTLIGQPWGKVHFFGDCEDDGHLNVLWQLSGKLLRSCVYARPTLSAPYSQVVERHADLAWDLSLLAAYEFARTEEAVIDKLERRVSFSGVELLVPTHSEHDHWMNPYFWKHRRPLEAWRKQVHERAALSLTAPAPDIVKKRDTLRRFYEAWEQRYQDSYQELASQEQIFIEA